MIWLQSWLQGTSAFGPRCVDGSLLRDIRLTREDCNQDETSTQPVAPGCEAELLSAPGTSQIVEQWLNKRQNKTKLNFSNKNHLAPLPEESDYFYDDYVDYPYNETIITEPVHLIGNENVKQHKAATTTTPKSIKTNASSHFVPGDTPTIYAATKNKTKTPSKVQGSPSSSGFTFFGLPLPTLNLNNLWGRTADAPLTIAERKSAIVNKPSRLDLPLFPQTQPEFQTGFKPILPGVIGGFKPIANPLITQNMSFSKRNDTQTASASKKRVFETTTTLRPTTTTTSKTTTTSTTTKYMLQEDFFLSMGHPISTPTTPKTTTTTERSVETTAKPLKTIENAPKTNATKIQAALQIDSGTKTILKIVPNNDTSSQTKNTSAQIEVAADAAAFFDDFDVIDNVSFPSPETTTPTATTTTKHVENVTEPKRELLPTTLTGFLVPGGQQPQFRPGRPTVTKVQSPQNPPLQSALAFPVDPLPYNREIKAIPRATTIKTEKDLSWYFANYNKTNLEPYVNRIETTTSESYAVRIETHKIIFMIPIIIFNAA